MPRSQILLITEERAWTVTLSTAQNAGALFAEDFERMVKYFNPSSAGEPLQPKKRRRRLKAGEMVNPDRLQY